MKQLYVMAFLCLFGIQFAGAQVKKGNVLVGGSAGIKFEQDKALDYKAEGTTYTFSPKVGYAISDKWLAGAYVSGIILNGQSSMDVGAVNMMEGIFVRNYHRLGNKLALFGEANVGYFHSGVRYNDVKHTDNRGIQVGVFPGLSYFVSKRFVLDGTFGGLWYSYGKFEDVINHRKTTSNGISLSFSEEFELGVSFLF
ncbi:hypothetical protein [Chitinophaga barathri]|uniref:Outer membrane protein beta-barrel domain-containing protein n=1 Tax=Chitinophaga barathri TaxID=1647451 RepID=A0A3N4M9J1_9BACT|nr:hypothetical protein [Chitinophaga barathri]RPD40394.1 hypothetical protein EG028_13880 [Chitinophaga barathri]